jgi:hypothetical protein
MEFAELAEIAGLPLLALIALVIAMIRKVWPIIRRLGDFADDWAGEPGRPGVPGRAGVMVRLQSIETAQADQGRVLKELQPNGGGSVRDLIHQLRDGMHGMKDDIEQLRAADDRRELRNPAHAGEEN